MKKSWMILISVVLTLFFAAFQRMTGPTHSVGGAVEVDGQKESFSFPRSGTTGKDTRIALPSVIDITSSATPDSEALGGVIFYRPYPAAENDSWQKIQMRWDKGEWVGFLPSQPMAGKLMYYVRAEGTSYFEDEPLVIRYKGDVPAGILVPHIILMFLAMFFAVMAGLAAIADNPLYKRYSLFTLVGLLSGGFLFGCLVQYHAFGVYWSGFPVGSDLTDNKTLIALIAFLIAWGVMIFRKKGRWAVLVASVVMLGIFCVPHSTNGSELERESGTVISGK